MSVHGMSMVCTVWMWSHFVQFCLQFQAGRQFLQEPVTIYECSDQYDPAMLDQVTGDRFLHLHSIICPSTHGFPIARKRVWGLLIKKDELVAWGTGSPLMLKARMNAKFLGLLKLHHRKLAVSFHDFLVATTEEQEKEKEWMCARPTATGCDGLNRSERIHLERYEAKLADMGMNAYQIRLTSCQLNQNPLHRALHSKEVPSESGGLLSIQVHHTLIKNVGVLWCNGRSITPTEMAL